MVPMIQWSSHETCDWNWNKNIELKVIEPMPLAKHLSPNL